MKDFKDPYRHLKRICIFKLRLKVTRTRTSHFQVVKFWNRTNELFGRLYVVFCCLGAPSFVVKISRYIIKHPRFILCLLWGNRSWRWRVALPSWQPVVPKTHVGLQWLHGVLTNHHNTVSIGRASFHDYTRWPTSFPLHLRKRVPHKLVSSL